MALNPYKAVLQKGGILKNNYFLQCLLYEKFLKIKKGDGERL